MRFRGQVAIGRRRKSAGRRLEGAGAATFIGLDLAWKIDGNHSGLAAYEGDMRGLRLRALAEGVTSQRAVVEFIAEHAAETTVVAVDGSLVVRNATGQRPCDRLVASAFGRYHASCHTTNLGRPHAQVGMNLVAALEAHGFVHDFDIERARQRPGRWLVEIYPHTAMIRLFDLPRIIRYKKGTVAEKKAGLAVLRRHLGSLARRGLDATSIWRELLARDLAVLRGRALKHYEDTLDAAFCGFLAWHCWRWGAERNEIYGTLNDGYILVPKAFLGD
jgi:predicted RNase H-like nuclease